jgi:hypothetical protein
MATLGARFFAAAGAEKAFGDMCMGAMRKMANSKMGQEAMNMGKEVLKDTITSEALDLMGMGPPPSVQRSSALSSVISGGVRGAAKELLGAGAGAYLAAQKKEMGVQPLASPPSLSSMASSAWSGLTSMCQGPSNPSFAARAPERDFGSRLTGSMTSGPSAIPMLTSFLPTFSPVPQAAQPRAYMPGFNPTRGGGFGIASPVQKARDDMDLSTSSSRKNKM